MATTRRNADWSVSSVTEDVKILLPPANEVMGQGNIFAPVCHSVHGGVCLSACWDTPRPGTPLAPPPRPGIPPPHAVHAGRYGQQAGGMHPTGMQSC